MDPVRVLIVDDDPLVRSGLKLLLRSAPDIEVVGDVADGDEVPSAVRQAAPAVVLMDIRMARVDGITATRSLRAGPGAPEVLVLTTFDADREVVAALQAGAAGFLVKDTPPEDIVRAIKAVAAGEPTLSPTVTRRLIDLVGADPDSARRDEARARLGALSDREMDVARGVGQGLANQEIADVTYMSVATVKAYVSRLLVKLDLNNRVQVALLVQEADLDRSPSV